MSQNPSGEVNPYAPPLYSGPERVNKPLRPYPLICRVAFSIDLLLLVVRGIATAACCVVVLSMSGKEAHYVAALGEAATGILMVAWGFPAAIGMLLGKRWGAWLAWGKVVASLSSVGVAAWLLIYLVQLRFIPGTPEFVGAIIGCVITVGFRLLLLILYAWAVVRFSRWVVGEENQPAAWMVPPMT